MLVEHWLHYYDWRRFETTLNRYPWGDTASAVAAFRSAPLAADERELISYRNAERLLRLRGGLARRNS